VVLKSYEFRREREATWIALEALLAQIDKRGVTSLSADELAHLPHLYRATLSSLSVARAISLDVNLVEYLESLSARAYFVVYGTKQHLRAALAVFFLRTWPAAMRRYRWHLAVAALFLALGVGTGYLITLGTPERFYAFVAPEYAQGRGPEAPTSELRAALYSDPDAGEALATFATVLFSHNAKIGITAFALGFALGMPVLYLMFVNGLILGAFAALYHGRGLSLDLWGWLLPHGVTELSAVAVCGAAGLIVAQALVFPGRATRLASLAERGREAGMLVLGAVMMFLVAGLIEGIFRQTVHSVPIRYAVAVATALAWGLYFSLVGRRERER
jgi:uncharacterized membrane protein SpoIIM required for sporulation